MVSCFVLLDCHLMEFCSFLKMKEEWVRERGEMGGPSRYGGKETVVRIYCMRE